MQAQFLTLCPLSDSSTTTIIIYYKIVHEVQIPIGRGKLQKIIEHL